MLETGLLRIGELSRRSGVSPDLLRAWERRYGLLHPTRSAGGLRLYSLDDLERVRTMQRHLAAGLAAAEAAELAARPDPERDQAGGAPSADVQRELESAVAAFDEPQTQSILDALLATSTIEAALADVLLPFLHRLGERWERGEASVAEEHFATAVLRGRLLGLARGWGRGLGPRAVLACAPGEQHDLGLIAFGLALRARGWRIVYLGADAPLDSVADAVDTARPSVAVISAVDPSRLHEHADALRALAQRGPLFLGGASADAAAPIAGVEMLHGGPVDEAEHLTRLVADGKLPIS
jgi:MerR family transcriptional regulator, light-induced transcriptional regulator